jgi:hypothetical protein
MRCREVFLARGIEQVLDPIEVEEEGVAAGTSEERVGTGLEDVWRVADEGDCRVGNDPCPNRFDGAGLRALCQVDAVGLLPVPRRREHIADRDVRQVIAVVIDVEAVDRVGMERVGVRIGIEDDHGPRRVRRRLERVEVAEIEPLVSERRTETEPSKVVRHFALLALYVHRRQSGRAPACGATDRERPRVAARQAARKLPL